jgi:hypothetical protein
MKPPKVLVAGRFAAKMNALPTVRFRALRAYLTRSCGWNTPASLTKLQALAASLAIAALPIVYQHRAGNQAKSERASLHAQLNELRQELNQQERRLATAVRAFRRVQIQLTEARGPDAPRMSRSEVSTTFYPWDEQSDYVRLPKALAPRLTFADFAGLVARTSYFTNASYSMTAGEYRTVYTPALPEGEAIRQQLRNALIDEMDATRADLFLNQIQSVCHDALNDFGRTASGITLSRNQEGRITYGEMYFNPDGSDRLNRSGPNLYVALPEALRPIVEQWTAARAQVQPSAP